MFGKGRFESHALPRFRMIERKAVRVQQLPVQLKFLLFRAVYGIARDRVSQMPAMHPYLVRPARFQRKMYERIPFFVAL